MFLKSLEMQGFKSFPDRTVLNFGKGITSVVGPNGSGKSNISDAIRWVLGEQSTKSLRGSKMEDIIFSGTGVRRALGYAEVTLRLDNTDRSLNGCDKDEIAVTRRYYRSGESEYLLGGEEVRLRDINELFMDTGLGRDGYSIVGQGRVADMISSRSTQRRDMLEEAAGISHFRYRRSDASRKLDQAQENLLRLRDILAELESRVGPLKTQSEKAKKFLMLADERRELEIGLWLHTIRKSKNGLKEQTDKIALASAQYDDCERKLGELTEKLESVIAQSQSITEQIESFRDNSSAIEEEATRLEGQIAVENNTIEHNSATIERISKDMEQTAGTERQLDEQIAEALAEIDAIIVKIGEETARLHSADEGIFGVRRESGESAEKSEELTLKTADITSELSDKRIEESALVSASEELKARIANIDTLISDRGHVVDEAEAARSVCAKALEDAKESAQELLNSLAGYRLREKSRRDKADRLKTSIDNLSLEIQQNAARAKMLEDLEKNMEGYAGSVRQVVREAKRGTLRGIHGTLSQLITVEPEYAAAIETALGQAVQDVVTDTEDDAKRAIAFLKENHAGRATFLPLTSVNAKDFTERGLEGCPGYIAMADELLEYDRQYFEIIKSLLGRTAVTDTLDSAVNMARKFGYRFKIVTLDGQVVNAGGSITGGSRGQNAGILSRANEIETLRTKVREMNTQLDNMLSDHKAFIEELSAACADLKGAEAELLKAQEGIIRREGELKTAESRFENVSSSMAELKAERLRSVGRTKELAEAGERLRADIAELSAQLEASRGELASLAKGREELESRREELSKLQAEINMNILSLQKDMEAKEEATASLRRRKSSHEGRVGELVAEIEEIKRANDETAMRIDEMSSRVAELREQSGDSRAKIEEMTAQRTALEQSNADLRAAERERSADKEKLIGELARLEERRAAMERDCEETKAKLYDEYTLTLREAEELNITLEDTAKAQRDLQDIKNKIRALGSVNVEAIDEYKEVSERYEFMSKQIADVEMSRDELLNLISDLTGKMAERFREQFVKINSFFGETFAELFDGGRAELILENPLDVLECNIEIKVQPPGKNIQNIDLLSGGEKGLSAIALLFAILKVTPSPFCVFDEVEAALDDINVTRYARYVRRMTKNTQFILITHRRGTMEEADVLYGVTMQEEGVSKLLELKTAEMAKKMGIA